MDRPTPVFERPELTPTWHILVPLVAVVASLIALAVVPPLLTRHNAELRRELTEVLIPLSAIETHFERSVAAEAAAIRGYALTSDPFFSDRFLTVSAYAETLKDSLDSLSGRTSAAVAAAVDSLVAERERWETVNFGLAPADIRERLPEHQLRYEALMNTAQALDQEIDRDMETLRHRIQAAEERRRRVTVALAVIALLAAAGTLWLAHGLRRSGQHLLRRAREEVALRSIAQTMAEAENLPGALGRIARLVADSTGADGAHIEQVYPDLDEVEVVAAVGSAATAEGARVPYGGSLAEEVLTRGEAARTSVEAVVREGRPLANLLPADRDQHLLVVPLLSEGEALGVLLLARTHGSFDPAEVQRIRLLADMAALTLRRLRLFAEIRAKEQALAATAAELRTLNETLEERVRERTARAQELSRALTLAEQRERRELAQVLHDDLQQIIYGLQLGLRTLELQAPDLDVASLQRQLRRSYDLAGEALDATRRLTADLSPPVLASEGFLEALRWLAAHVEERFGLRVDLKAEDGLATPPDDRRELLFQTVRELLFNVVKHAGTDRATVSLFEHEGAFTIEVIDEGVGFDPSSTSPGSNGALGGFGLRRARERLELFGGCVELTSAPECGTRATVSLPLERSQPPHG